CLPFSPDRSAEAPRASSFAPSPRIWSPSTTPSPNTSARTPVHRGSLASDPRLDILTSWGMPETRRREPEIAASLVNGVRRTLIEDGRWERIEGDVLSRAPELTRWLAA